MGSHSKVLGLLALGFKPIAGKQLEEALEEEIENFWKGTWHGTEVQI